MLRCAPLLPKASALAAQLASEDAAGRWWPRWTASSRLRGHEALLPGAEEQLVVLAGGALQSALWEVGEEKEGGCWLEAWWSHG